MARHDVIQRGSDMTADDYAASYHYLAGAILVASDLDQVKRALKRADDLLIERADANLAKEKQQEEEVR